jgi:Tfp pilus assembly protein PilV
MRLEADMFSGEKGFTILEIVIGVAIFMVGMLGVAALEISSIRAEAFSIRLTEATLLARSSFEELMSAPYSDARLDDDDFSGRDTGTSAGVPDSDNDVDMGVTTDKNVDADANDVPDAFENADEVTAALQAIGTNGIFNVAWSACEDCLIDDTKMVRIIVYWRIKSGFRSVEYYGLIPRS